MILFAMKDMERILWRYATDRELVELIERIRGVELFGWEGVSTFSTEDTSYRPPRTRRKR